MKCIDITVNGKRGEERICIVRTAGREYWIAQRKALTKDWEGESEQTA